MACAARSEATRRGLCLAALPLIFALAAGLGPAAAEKVGVAAAVNPDAFSSLSSAPNSQLNIGKSIFYNERISTTGSGLVQVLLVDGSTFTVGPGSNLVIDKFVYNPKKQTGEMVATFSKGAMRYVGGKISKNEDGVTVKTPNGSLAVRGGMVQGIVSGNTVLFSFLFGKEMVFTAKNGQTYTVFQPGYTLDLSGGVVKVRPTTAADIAKVVALLTNSDTSAVSSTDQPGEGPDVVSQLSNISNDIADLINQATANRIQAELQAQLLLLLFQPQPPTPPTPAVTEHFNGYAAMTLIGSDYNYANMFLGVTPAEFAMAFNSGTQKGDVTMSVQDVFDEAYAANRFRFAIPIGTTYEGYPGHFGEIATEAFESDGQLPYARSTGVFVIGNPQGGAALCSKCDFMKWGVMAAVIESGSSGPTDSVDLAYGFWVAGDLPTIGQLPTSGSATYTGGALGWVASRPNISSSWSQSAHPAYGNVNMTWNFANRTGNLAISNFDAAGPLGAQNFSGTMNMSGPNSAMNRFHGQLGGSLSGFAYGSFARKGSDPAAGVLGNWAATNSSYGPYSTYRATGVFGATR